MSVADATAIRTVLGSEVEDPAPVGPPCAPLGPAFSLHAVTAKSRAMTANMRLVCMDPPLEVRRGQAPLEARARPRGPESTFRRGWPRLASWHSETGIQ